MVKKQFFCKTLLSSSSKLSKNLKLGLIHRDHLSDITSCLLQINDKFCIFTPEEEARIHCIDTVTRLSQDLNVWHCTIHEFIQNLPPILEKALGALEHESHVN